MAEAKQVRYEVPRQGFDLGDLFANPLLVLLYLPFLPFLLLAQFFQPQPSMLVYEVVHDPRTGDYRIIVTRL